MNDNRFKTTAPTPVRGSVWYADLSPVIGSEQGGLRPVVILQNDMGNIHAPTVIAAAMTSVYTKHAIPTHVKIPASAFNGVKDSLVLCEQIRTLDKSRLREMIGTIPDKYLKKIDQAVKVSFSLT